MQLQQDRLMGNFETTSYENNVAGLRAVDAANWRTPPLPPSPCIRVKATGEIHEWAPFFANRPDICENCDEFGNTDPAAWQGRRSPQFEANVHKEGMPMAPMESAELAARLAKQASKPAQAEPAQPQPPLPAPPGLLFNMNEFSAGLLESDVPQVGAAPLVLGIPASTAKDYAQLGTIKAAMPLPRDGGVPVRQAVHEAFSAG